jgi:lysophospholipase
MPPALAERFLAPPDFTWGRFETADGAMLRWGHLPVHTPRAECVMVGGYGEFIELQFEIARDFAARGIAVWCFDWRGQGGSARPERWPSRSRARQFNRDAGELAAFAAANLTSGLPRFLVAHSMGGATALLCLARYAALFDAGILSAPMLGLRIGRVPPTALRCVTGPIRFSGLGCGYIPGAPRFHPRQMPSPRTSRVSSDPERCRVRYAWQTTNPALRLGRPTYAWLDAALGLIAQINRREFLATVRTPILLGCAGRDIVVSTKAQRRAARLMPNCTLAELSGSKHEPFLERDDIRNAWFAHIDRFLDEHLPLRQRKVFATGTDGSLV